MITYRSHWQSELGRFCCEECLQSYGDTYSTDLHSMSHWNQTIDLNVIDEWMDEINDMINLIQQNLGYCQTTSEFKDADEEVKIYKEIYVKIDRDVRYF